MADESTRAKARAIQRGIKSIDKQIKNLDKKIKKLQRDMSLPMGIGVFKHMNPFDMALLAISLVVDTLLAVIGFFTFELSDIVDWIIELGMYIFLAVAGFALIFTSPRAAKKLPSTLVLFILSFIIEVLPAFSILPAITAFAARIIYVVNKAKLEVRVEGLEKDKKRLNKQKQKLEFLLQSNKRNFRIAGAVALAK